MMYFVYYDKGRCNDGDHDNALEEYRTLDEAKTRIDALRPLVLTDEGTLRLFAGMELPVKEKEAS